MSATTAGPPGPSFASHRGTGDGRRRQIHRRARRHVGAERARTEIDAAGAARIVEQFLTAALSGDTEPLVRLLADDAVTVPDGGGKITARGTPVHGAVAIARYVRGLFRPNDHKRAFVGGAPAFHATVVNDAPSVLIEVGNRIFGVLSLEVTPDGISAVHVQVNPDKLRHITRRWAATGPMHPPRQRAPSPPAVSPSACTATRSRSPWSTPSPTSSNASACTSSPAARTSPGARCGTSMRTGVRVRIARVHSVDADRETVELTDDNGTEALGYDALVYALGSTAAASEVPGVAEHAHNSASRERSHAASTLAPPSTGPIPPTCDTVLDAHLGLGVQVAEEAAKVAAVLCRLSSRPLGTVSWRDHHARFVSQYGTGLAVPVLDVVSDAGPGYPAGYLARGDASPCGCGPP